MLDTVRGIAEPSTDRSDELRRSSYVRVDELASGGMGRVELCVRRYGTFSRLYAVKRLHPHLREDAGMRAMFLDEARVAGLVRHINVVSVLDLGEDVEGPFLVMDYVEGVSLSRFVQQHDRAGELLPIGLCVQLVAQVARGLHAAHELAGPDGAPLRLVHRDVSPQNVLVGHDGIVRVTDFGIAKALGRSAHTSTGLLKGKVGYMSPEQLRFEAVDRRSDLFALGVVLFELLTTRRLYRGEDAAEVARMILHDPPPDLGDVRPDLTPGVVELGFRLLAKDREDRPATAAEVADLLEEAIADDPVDIAQYVEARFGDELRARRSRVQARLSQLDDTPASEAGESSVMVAPDPRPTTARRKRMAIATAASASLLAVVALAMRSTSSDGAEPTTDALDTSDETETVILNIESRPPGATLRVGDRVLGVAPARLELPRGTAAIVELEMPGYASTTHEISAIADERLVIALVPAPLPTVTSAPVPSPSVSTPPERSSRSTARKTRSKRPPPSTAVDAAGPRERFRRFD